MPSMEAVDGTMDWFQQEEPIRRRPPRQLRSRTIGQIRWDSKVGCRTYDAEEGILLEEIYVSLPSESSGSWYGWDARKGWSDPLRQLLYDPRPVVNEVVHVETDEDLRMISWL